MINKINKNEQRVKRHVRLRHDLAGTTKRTRLCVYRSLSNIYAQIIDDEKAVTLISCNTTQKEIKSKIAGKTNKEQARIVGEEVAKLAIKNKITEVVFDRGGYLYTGRVKELADGARAAGLKF